jgi:predicted TIM-barrel fold metal-dependent hydrolase
MDASEIQVVDADSHLTEPPDLWTSRLPKKWSSEMPRVQVESASGIERWRIGDAWCSGVGTQSQAGWAEYPPSFPPTWSDINPWCYSADARLSWMDEHGIQAQVLYPNITAFEGWALMALPDAELRLAIIRAYNDYIDDFCTAGAGRFVRIASLPFWDTEASVTEMKRCAELGFVGVLWAATLTKHGLPPTADHHWDPIYQTAQDLGLSINFHVGVGSTADDIARFREKRSGADLTGYWAAASSLGFLANASTISDLITSGVCHRFPNLNFVSVESGFGFVPFLLEALDWQWASVDAPSYHPGWLMPSEYFKRQIYCTFWFEQASLPLLNQYEDNVMFETDFPHSTSLSPGPASASPPASELINRAIANVGPSTMVKVLQTNAQRLYRLS